jgi:hypothetical protein
MSAQLRNAVVHELQVDEAAHSVISVSPVQLSLASAAKSPGGRRSRRGRGVLLEMLYRLRAGIGSMTGERARSHASATCAGVA